MIAPVVKEKSYRLYPIGVGDDRLYITASVQDEVVDPILLCEELYHHIGDIIQKRGLQIVQERIFASLSNRDGILKTRLQSLHASGLNGESSVTYIEGNPAWGEGFAGIQVYAVKPTEPGDKIWTIYDGKLPCGRGWRLDGTTFLSLQDIHGNHGLAAPTRSEQTGRMFDRARALLQSQGMNYRNVVRTWIYLSEILEWYKEFNQVRDKKYMEYGLIPTRINGVGVEEIYLPASTGIEGSNCHGAAGTMDVIALQGDSGAQVTVFHNTGSKQRSPFRYGSAFSRSTVVREKKSRTIYVSGTASIGENGTTLGVDDFSEQVRNTLDVVGSLIKPEGASFEDVCQATVFLKRTEDFPEYQRVIKELGLENIPAVCVLADVCRDELLFEIDCIAIIK